MKIRQGFVSNSSSTAYIITNKSNKTKKIVDFVKENPQFVQEWNEQYGGMNDPNALHFVCGSLLGYGDTYTQAALEQSAIKDRGDEIFVSHQSKEIFFGDEEENIIGRVFDYILRKGGESKSFRWRFDHWAR